MTVKQLKELIANAKPDAVVVINNSSIPQYAYKWDKNPDGTLGQATQIEFFNIEVTTTTV